MVWQDPREFWTCRPCKKCLYIPKHEDIKRCPECGFAYKTIYTKEEQEQFHPKFKETFHIRHVL